MNNYKIRLKVNIIAILDEQFKTAFENGSFIISKQWKKRGKTKGKFSQSSLLIKLVRFREILDITDTQQKYDIICNVHFKKGDYKIEDVARLVQCYPSMHKALGRFLL